MTGRGPRLHFPAKDTRLQHMEKRGKGHLGQPLLKSPSNRSYIAHIGLAVHELVVNGAWTEARSQPATAWRLCVSVCCKL